MALLIIAVIIGLFYHQRKKYWIHVAMALIFRWTFLFLFNADGSIGNKLGDGMLLQTIRSTNNDWTMTAIGLLVVFISWGVPIYIIKKAFRKEDREENLSIKDRYLKKEPRKLAPEDTTIKIEK